MSGTGFNGLVNSALGSPAAIGNGTPNTGAFTTLSTTGLATLNSLNLTTPLGVAYGGTGPGTIITYAGTTAPTGYLICPTAPANISRSTYAALFSAIGTTWGAGDGTTTFGIPWFAAGFAHVQASSNVGTATTGQVISHQHTLQNLGSAQAGPDNGGVGVGTATGWSSGNSQGPTAFTGGTNNLPAGTAVLMCVKY